MPTVALENIPDGADANAAPLRNNFAAVQAAVNALDANNWAAGKQFHPDKIMQDGAGLGQALVWGGTDWAPATIASAGFAAVYRKTTEKDVVNTAAETDLLNGEITIGAGSMSTNRLLRATLLGDYLNNSGASRTLTVKIKLGGTVIYEDTLTATTASATRRAVRLGFEIANLGAANSQFMAGAIGLSNVVAATTGLGGLDNLGNDAGGDSSRANIIATNGAVAIDTSTAKLLEVTVTHSVANASLSARLKYALIEII